MAGDVIAVVVDAVAVVDAAVAGAVVDAAVRVDGWSIAVGTLARHTLPRPWPMQINCQEQTTGNRFNRICAIALIVSCVCFEFLVSPFLRDQMLAQDVPVPVIWILLFILPRVFWAEGVCKVLWLYLMMTPGKLVLTRAAQWKQIDQVNLEHYTDELQALGFKQLGDYSAVGALEDTFTGIGRVFAHPQKHYYAEVVMVANGTAFCTIGCRLEKQWILSVCNMPTGKSMFEAIGQTFMKPPRQALVKRMEQANTNQLFTALVNWQKDVSQSKNIAPLPCRTMDDYFASLHWVMSQRRRKLVFQSLTWMIIKTLLLSDSIEAKQSGTVTQS
jgi:hypothetical protein